LEPFGKALCLHHKPGSFPRLREFFGKSANVAAEPFDRTRDEIDLVLCGGRRKKEKRRVCLERRFDRDRFVSGGGIEPKSAKFDAAEFVQCRTKHFRVEEKLVRRKRNDSARGR